MTEIHHLSYSAITAYSLCARSYKFRYIDHVPTKVSSNLAFGSAFHDAIEEYLVTRAGGKATLALGDLWASHWQSQSERGEIVCNNTSLTELDAQGKRMLTGKVEVVDNTGTRICQHAHLGGFLDTLKPATDSQGRTRIEERITLQVPGMPVPVIGYIDMIGTDGVPCDFKTSARVWDSDKARNELQPAFYLAALNQAGHACDGRFHYYIFTKAKQPKVQVIETRREARDLFGIMDLALSTWRAIEAKAFPPSGMGTWKCDPVYCEFFGVCRGE